MLFAVARVQRADFPQKLVHRFARQYLRDSFL
jgi:hypothetical protein